MTSHPYIPSDDFIEEYLREPLTPEKKEYLAKLREEWERQQQEELQRIIGDDPWMFMVSEWWEQGCGRTIFLGMTQAVPEDRDFDRNGKNPYTPITTKEERAIRKFKEKFGEYFTQDLKFITREKFFGNYSEYLPPRLYVAKDELCSVEYFSELHINFS